MWEQFSKRCGFLIKQQTAISRIMNQISSLLTMLIGTTLQLHQHYNEFKARGLSREWSNRLVECIKQFRNTNTDILTGHWDRGKWCNHRQETDKNIYWDTFVLVTSSYAVLNFDCRCQVCLGIEKQLELISYLGKKD